MHLSDVLGKGLPERRDRLLAAALGLAVVASFVRAASAHSWYELDNDELAACRSIQSMSDAGDRVVIIGDKSPQLLFCIDRKGWLLGDYEADEARIRGIWHDGARLAVLLHSFDAPNLRRLLADNGRLVLNTPTLELYALALAREGADKHPEDPVLRNNCAVLLEATGSVAEAETMLRESLAGDASLPQPFKNLGDLCYRSGRYEEAITLYERATALDPSLGDDVYFKLGNLAFRDRNASRAAECWEKAVSLNPGHQLARANLDTLRMSS